MKTEARLALVLKQLMSEDKSLDDISVTLLTKKCKINRQTFYYHFHDIYDLLTLVFLNEKITNIEKVTNLDDLINIIFDYYKQNSRFLDGVLQSAGKDLLNEFLFNNCFQSCYRILNLYQESKKLTTSEKKSIARFYGYAYSNLISFYLQNFKRKTLEGLKNHFLANPANSLQKAIENVLIIKKINGK